MDCDLCLTNSDDLAAVVRLAIARTFESSRPYKVTRSGNNRFVPLRVDPCGSKPIRSSLNSERPCVGTIQWADQGLDMSNRVTAISLGARARRFHMELRHAVLDDALPRGPTILRVATNRMTAVLWSPAAPLR